MDWVQIYTIGLMSLNLLISAYRHGKPKEGNDSFWVALIAIMLALPYLGRVFGWW